MDDKGRYGSGPPPPVASREYIPKPPARRSSYQYNTLGKKSRSRPTAAGILNSTAFTAPVVVHDDEWSTELGSSEVDEGGQKLLLIDSDRYTPYYKHYFFARGNVKYFYFFYSL